MKFLKEKKDYLSLRVAGVCLAILLALIWMYGTNYLGVPSYFLIFGLLIIAVAIWNLITIIKESKVEQLDDTIDDTHLIAPTFVYEYCSTCLKAITDRNVIHCQHCGNKL